REVALAVLKVGGCLWKLCSEPLAVSKGDHQIRTAVPDRSRSCDLPELESPRFREGQVIVEPAINAGPQRLMERRRHVLSELVGQHGLVHLRKEGVQRRDDA